MKGAEDGQTDDECENVRWMGMVDFLGTTATTLLARAVPRGSDICHILGSIHRPKDAYMKSRDQPHAELGDAGVGKVVVLMCRW